MMLKSRRAFFGSAALAALASLVPGRSAMAQRLGIFRHKHARATVAPGVVIVDQQAIVPRNADAFRREQMQCVDCALSSVDTTTGSYVRSSNTTVTLTGDFPYQAYIVNIDDESNNARWTVYGDIYVAGTSANGNYAQMQLSVRITKVTTGLGGPTTGKLNFTVDGGPSAGGCVAFLPGQPVNYSA